MQLHLVNFAYGDKYVALQEKQRQSLSSHFANIFSYGNNFLYSSGFYGRNANMIEVSITGRGYCSWKPLIMLDAMDKIDSGDYLLYSDVADEIYNNKFFEWVANRTSELNGKLIGWNNYVHGNWTKRDCFILMHCDREEYWNHLHLEAGTICFRKQEDTIQLLKEWLEWNQFTHVIDKSPSVLGNELPGFVDHRTDQSILTNLVIERGWKCSTTQEIKNYIHYNEFDKDLPSDKHTRKI